MHEFYRYFHQGKGSGQFFHHSLYYKTYWSVCLCRLNFDNSAYRYIMKEDEEEQEILPITSDFFFEVFPFNIVFRQVSSVILYWSPKGCSFLCIQPILSIRISVQVWFLMETGGPRGHPSVMPLFLTSPRSVNEWNEALNECAVLWLLRTWWCITLAQAWPLSSLIWTGRRSMMPSCWLAP